MQVILSALRRVKSIISSALQPGCTGNVVLIYTLCVPGIASSIRCRSPSWANGSPPVKTKSHSGVMASITAMDLRIASTLKPVQSAYSFLLIQKGQWLRQSYGTKMVTVAPPDLVL